VLVVEDLHVGYATSHVLNGIDLTVERGESVALLGRNGMGKTTLVRAICGMTPPRVTAGTITLDGTDLLRLRPYLISRHGVGVVPQGRHVFGSLTVEENLKVIPHARGGEWTVERVYEFFPRLEERRRSFARTLSGGEQQMLAIGRALMTNPSLLIMDEPSEGLAPAVLQDIQERLQQLRATGLSVLIAEQNVDLALGISDRVFVLGEDGVMAWSGDSAQLLIDPEPVRSHLGL
jgi:branched-chain amino acid transport system ATP-binding protein